LTELVDSTRHQPSSVFVALNCCAYLDDSAVGTIPLPNAGLIFNFCTVIERTRSALGIEPLVNYFDL